MSATFDTTTKAAYDAATTAADRAAAIVASLSSGGSPQGAVRVKVFSGASPDVEMGSGTMTAPWATASGGTVVIGEVSSFTVGTTGTPDANWYIKFQTLDATRWARGSFGLASSTQDFKWSLATWEDGQTGTIGTATIVCTGNAAPVFTVAPTTASIAATGGTIQFTATDPDGGTIIYSLTTTRSGITINSTTGLVTVTSAAAGTSGNVVVRASDGILTASTSCAVTVAISAIKWNPGHYMAERSFQQKTSVTGVDITDSKGARFSHYDLVSFKNNANVKGVAVWYRWSQLEADTRGNYTAGIAYVQAELDKLAALHAETGIKKTLILRIMDKRYQSGITMASAPDWYPQYMIDAGYVYISNSRDLQWKRWNSTAMGWFINLCKAYGAAFDSNPYFEMISPFTESAINVTAPISPTGAIDDWDEAEAVTQYRRWVTEVKQSFPTSQVWATVNWIPYSVANQTSFYSLCNSNDVASGNTDTSDTTSGTGIWADRILRGYESGSTDWRGVIPIVLNVEDSTIIYASVGGKTMTPAEVYAYRHNTMRCNYQLWDRIAWGTSAQNWETGILPVINANPLTVTALPSCFG